jgi:hypothetical protein
LDLKELARKGAEVRLAELQAEIQALRKAFPGLAAGGVDAAGIKWARGLRKPMTAAQKAEVSKRMKKYWAARRKSNIS